MLNTIYGDLAWILDIFLLNEAAGNRNHPIRKSGQIYTIH